jgi:poly-gamma-glutamate synthesis protein (capsule biosynthesis protein)
MLAGDVMVGRGIDQLLPHPNDPVLYEEQIRDARAYVQLAEAANGPIPRLASLDYVWGDALAEVERAHVAVRIVNLETSITARGQPWAGKGIHYRMHPDNVGCLTVARLSCCCLANNHVLDWGYEGLEDTLAALRSARIAGPGAGRNLAEAAAPAVLAMPGAGRVLVFSAATSDSGVPDAWRATDDRPGVNLLDDLSERTAESVATRVRAAKRPGDVAIFSVHWGSNWGYDVPAEQIAFAHRLTEGGVDVVHGHSSHHPRPIGLHDGHLVLYGCGDLINDYEGIGGNEAYRPELRLLYLARIGRRTGRLEQLKLLPVMARRFRLEWAPEADIGWLVDLLDRYGRPFGTGARLGSDGTLSVGAR